MNTQIARNFSGTLNDLEYPALKNDAGKILYPDTATFELTDGDVTINVPGGTFTLDASTGVTGYAWASAESAEITSSLPRENVRIRWTFTDGATTYYRTQYIDFVAVEIRTELSDSNLISRLDLLRTHRKRLSGTTTANGTTTTLIDTSQLGIYDPNYFLGSYVEMKDGSNRGSNSVITLSDQQTQTLTFEPAFQYGTENLDAYEIELSFQPQIRQAWRVIHQYLKEWLDSKKLVLLDGLDFERIHLALSLQYAAETNVRTKDDEFDLAVQRFAKEYANALQELNVKLDAYWKSTNFDDGNSNSVIEKKHYVYWGS